MDIRKNEKVTVTELKEQGFKYKENYGSWQVWVNKEKRIFVNNKNNIVEEIFDYKEGGENEFYNLSKMQTG